MEKFEPSNTTQSNTLLSPEQVANILGISSFTVRRWIRNERLEAIRIGPKMLRIPDYAVLAILKKTMLPKTTTEDSNANV